MQRAAEKKSKTRPAGSKKRFAKKTVENIFRNLEKYIKILLHVITSNAAYAA